MALPSSGPLALTDIQGEFGGANPIGMNEYYAGGGLVPAGTSGTYGAVPSSGALSVQNFYGTSNFVPVYIENVFSTWLYKGNDTNGSPQPNGVGLGTYGGLVWTKSRNNGSAAWHYWIDSVRGLGNVIYSNTANQQDVSASGRFFSGGVWNSNGYTLTSDGNLNSSSDNNVSWSFQKQPKFFDVVTYTGDGSYTRSISHALGSTPGCVIIKRLDGSGNWYVWHRSIDPTYTLYLDATNAATPIGVNWSPDSSTFTATTQNTTNNSGYTYVAYLFAHNAGGFGLTGSDNVISCGSFTGATTVNLGYEPQWVLLKSTTATQDWFLIDTMMGWTADGTYNFLQPNNAYPEAGGTNGPRPTSTGFYWPYGGNTYIYIAIRRGPMKVPTVGTTVYTPTVVANDSTSTNMNFPIDVFWETNQAGSTYNTSTATRLSGNASMLRTSGSNDANGFFSSLFSNSQQNYYTAGLYGGGTVVTQYGFRRAPSFMDIVCYTGTGVARTINHNLGTTPEWIIVKRRSGTESGFGSGDWYVYSSALGNDYFVLLNGGDSRSNSGIWNYTSPTSSVFSVGTFFTNYSGDNYIAYLFATCPGVSKVGSYTGNGSLRTIDCGFTTGARFILIRQTGAGGGPWYLWDSARGISSGNDPFNYLNTTLADVTNTNYVATTSVGFQLTAAAFDTVNTSGAPYIFLAIA